MERQRQSIPIAGINRAESDDTVKDGACEDIYNLRYRVGAFENVRQPLFLHPIEQSGGFSVVHRLDTMEPGEYLAEKGSALYRVKIVGGTVAEQEKITDLPADVADVRYFHFGNVLYVNYTQGGELQEKVFIYKERRFSQFDLSAIVSPEYTVTCEYKQSPLKDIPGTKQLSTRIAEITWELYKPYEGFRDMEFGKIIKEEFFYNSYFDDLEYFTGTSYLMLGYKLFDGSIVKTGQIFPVSDSCGEAKVPPDLSDPRTADSLLYRTSDIPGTLQYRNTYYNVLHQIMPTVTIAVPDNITANGIVKSVVVLSTRNIPTYLFDKIHKFEMNWAETATQGVYNCTRSKLLNDELVDTLGPFYEIAELDFRNGETSLSLTHNEHYKNIESLPVYSPNYSCHNTISGGKYEYNDRLHIHNIKTDLFDGYDGFVDPPKEIPDGWTRVEGAECITDYTLTVNGEQHVVRKKSVHPYWQLGSPLLNLFHINAVQSYPDSRAEKVDLWVRVDSKTILSKTCKLLPSPGVNYAQSLLASGNHLSSKLQVVLLPGRLTPSTPTPKIREQNKIQVSYPSNPFVYAPANIYAIGGQGEQIREIISTAERMTEVAYGYQPLLVFTNRATYALESGEGEVLYARNIPILSQSMIEGTNAVEGDGAVFFVSTSGVTAIVRGQISTISEPMKRWAGLVASDATIPDFEKYTRAARLMFNRKESELIVYNSSYSYAYIYSLLGKYWTRRAWDAVIEPCFGEIVTADGVASLFEEDPERVATSCKLVTRPLKFGSLEYKRLETLAARMRWGQGCGFSLSIDGSDDAMRWVPLRSESNMPTIRRTPSSFRYHRFTLTGSVADQLAITHFDVEFYNKFVHRLR